MNENVAKVLWKLQSYGSKNCEMIVVTKNKNCLPIFEKFNPSYKIIFKMVILLILYI